MTLSSLEAPSNYLAFRLEMEALRHDLRLKVVVNRVPEPDPRQPIVDVKYLLWKYDGNEAAPGLPPPAADVAERIAGLAAAPFDEQANWAAAGRAAEELGENRVGEILAVMVHPPPVPVGTGALSWLPRKYSGRPHRSRPSVTTAGTDRRTRGPCCRCCSARRIGPRKRPSGRWPTWGVKTRPSRTSTTPSSSWPTTARTSATVRGNTRCSAAGSSCPICTRRNGRRCRKPYAI